MSSIEFVSVVKDLLTIFALLLGGAAAIFIYYQLSPVFTLRILPRWAGETDEYLIIRVEVENKSRVRVVQPRGRFQVLKHESPTEGFVSNWVAFEKEKVRPSEKPINWTEPIPLFTSTLQIYPGEMIAYEYLYQCSDPDVVFHIGLQVSMELSFFERLITGKREDWRQTTTAFAARRQKGVS